MSVKKREKRNKQATTTKKKITEKTKNEIYIKTKYVYTPSASSSSNKLSVSLVCFFLEEVIDNFRRLAKFTKIK